MSETSSSSSSYPEFVRKKRWRKTKDMFQLHEIKDRFPDLDNHVLMEMVLDWMEGKAPSHELVSEVWEGSSQFLVNVEYQDLIRIYLSRKYRLAYLCRTRPVPRFPALQRFPLSRTQVTDFQEQRPIRLSVTTCTFCPEEEEENCHSPASPSPHEVSIRLVGSEETAHRVEVTTISNPPPSGHTHDQESYCHWFILNTVTGGVLSLSVRTIKEIVEVLRKCKDRLEMCVVQGAPDESDGTSVSSSK